MKRYAISRKIELLTKFAHPAVGKFATAQEAKKAKLNAAQITEKSRAPFRCVLFGDIAYRMTLKLW